MKQRLILSGFAVMLLAGAWGGCADRSVVPEKAADSAVVALPEFLVGTWQPDDSRWLLTLSEDGAVTRMRHFVGVEFIVAEGGTVEPWKNDAEAAYFLGPCEAKYDAENEVLTVSIAVEHYIVTFENGTLEGSFLDVLSGPLLEGGKVWQAEWRSTGTMLDGDEDKISESEPKMLRFTRVSEEVYEAQ